MPRTQGERIVVLERGLKDHEDRCEERLGEIKADGAATRATVAELQKFVVGLIVAVAGGSLTIIAGIVIYALKLGG